MKKDFDGWNDIKKNVQNEQAPLFKQRDIWWCSIGTNVGDEIDGKNTPRSRPVLVLRKFNKQIFWGIPLTTQIKNNPYYHIINFKNREQCLMLSQLRILDSRRLTVRMGYLPEDQFENLRRALIQLI